MRGIAFPARLIKEFYNVWHCNFSSEYSLVHPSVGGSPPGPHGGKIAIEIRLIKLRLALHRGNKVY